MSFEDLARKRGMRIHLDITVSKPAGRGHRWTAQAGPWQTDGVSEKAAVDALAEQLRRFLLDYREPVVLSFRGWTAVLALDLGDDNHPMRWTEQLLGPDGRVRHSSSADESWQHARARTCYQLALRSTDSHDDTSVHEAAAYLRQQSTSTDQPFGPDELYRDAAWQRAARAAIDAGREDWHEWASDHYRDFALRPADNE